MPRSYGLGSGGTGLVVDPRAGRGIEEVQVAGVDGELDPLALAGPRRAVDAGDEGRPALAGAHLGRFDRLVAHGLAELLGVDGRRLDGQVEVDLGAHVLADLDLGADPLAFMRLAGDLGVLEILGPDADDHRLPLEGAQPGARAHGALLEGD